ncbi:hypothetical protein SBRV1_gp29 [Sulfolobales Beppu rod-shaped virus 1]|uniref:Uncharacterized protein n=1 Tax=Sulfolobales Beppu rod-shaped virus 1 TaxID=2493121 RepID=A0A3Q8Q9G6_9VIRU|nr:hypothetical protein QIT32_gp29 [Sulfolobales Beppu rod-shaped virus 1]AZI75918.1 hypothetical protein SBRV1_gp29 [Sulfolobales Beppu rod-shaped virus 1]
MTSEHALRFVYGIIPIFCLLISLLYRIIHNINYIIYIAILIAIVWSVYEIYYSYIYEKILGFVIVTFVLIALTFGINLAFFFLTWDFSPQKILNDIPLIISFIIYFILGILLNFSREFKEIIKRR